MSSIFLMSPVFCLCNDCAYGMYLKLLQTKKRILSAPQSLIPPLNFQHHYMYGHSGYGGQNSCADSKYRVGWAYVTNYTDPTAWGATKHR